MDKLQEDEIIRIKKELLDKKVNDGFVINNLECANWAFRKIRALKAKIQEVENLAAKENERVETWKNNVIAEDQDSISFFEFKLKEYYRQQKQENSKFKLTTPNGKISCRKNKKWHYDEFKIKEWCKENGHEDLIRVSEDLDKNNFKQIFKDGIDPETGEIIEGVSVEEIENISVKVD